MRHLPRRLFAHDSPVSSRSSVCRSCRRLYATAVAPPPKPPPSGLAQLSSRQLLSVAGPDAVKFLQGIITGNVAGKDGTQRKEGFYAGFLTATGRVLYDVFVYPNPAGLGNGGNAEENGFLIEVDTEQIDALAKYIKRYKLRAKVNVRKLLPDEVSVWQAWDDATASADIRLPQTTSSLHLKDPRAPGLGYRILQAGSTVPEVDLERTEQDAYTIRRYLNGVPEGQNEILKETALPQETNMDIMNGIDFHKGCYVGQELTIRTRHRGVVRKRILPCVIYPKDKPLPSSLAYSSTSPDPENPITAEMIPEATSIGRHEKRGRSAGKWLGGVGNVGLGLCRLEIMTDVTLPGETAQAAFQPDDEFVLDWGEDDSRSGVKIKAFVPDWIRDGLASSTRR